jgi:hypothetical protein
VEGRDAGSGFDVHGYAGRGFEAGTDLSGTRMQGADFGNARMLGADISSAHFQLSVLARLDLENGGDWKVPRKTIQDTVPKGRIQDTALKRLKDAEGREKKVKERKEQKGFFSHLKTDVTGAYCDKTSEFLGCTTPHKKILFIRERGECLAGEPACSDKYAARALISRHLENDPTKPENIVVLLTGHSLSKALKNSTCPEVLSAFNTWPDLRAKVERWTTPDVAQLAKEAEEGLK